MTCKELEQDLALTAVEGLDPKGLALVREHIQTCPHCAERLQNYKAICAAHITTGAELQKLAQRSKTPTLQPTATPVILFTKQFWRWLFPIGAAGLVALMFLLARTPAPHSLVPLEQIGGRSNEQPLPPGSLASYRKALKNPGDGMLDSVLARDADLLLRPPSANELQRLMSELF